LAAQFARYTESGEINSTVADPQAVLQKLGAVFADRGSFDRLDGLTVSGTDWWFNVRSSNTEPLLRLNVEARDPATMIALRDEVLGLIRG
jgi:phosphomannomutase